MLFKQPSDNFESEFNFYFKNLKFSLINFEGFDIPKRKQRKASVGASHLIKKEETMKWFQTKYSGIITAGK